MKPSCCSSISRLLRTFLSTSSMVFGEASGVSSSSIRASAGAEGAASRSVGERGSLPEASRRRLHVRRAAARREADAQGLRSAAAKQRGRWRRAGARGRRRRQTGEGGGRGNALRGRAEPRAPHAPWPAAEEAARRHPALLWQRPPRSVPRAASQHRGTAASMRLPDRRGQV